MNMAKYEITAKLNLEKIIAESREVAQALNEFADNLERIEKKYGTETEDEEYEMVNLGNGLFEKRRIKNE
jgi:hypothetical protein